MFPDLEWENCPLLAIFFGKLCKPRVMRSEEQFELKCLSGKTFWIFLKRFGNSPKSFISFVDNSIDKVQIAIYLSRSAFRWKFFFVGKNQKKTVELKKFEFLVKILSGLAKRHSTLKEEKWAGRRLPWDNLNFYFAFLFSSLAIEILYFWLKIQSGCQSVSRKKTGETNFVDRKVRMKTEIERKFSGLSAENLVGVVIIAI